MKKKIFGIFVIMLFFGAGIIPSISGFTTKFTDVKSIPGIENIIPPKTLYLSTQPDLVIYTKTGVMGDGDYYPPTVQNYGYTVKMGFVYLFVIELQNDGDQHINVTIQTTKLSGFAFASSMLYYPNFDDIYVTMPLNSTPQYLRMLYPTDHRLMLLVIYKIPFFPQVKVQLDAVETSGGVIDSFIVHT